MSMLTGTTLSNASLTVAQLERALSERFPASTGEPWDRNGCVAGFPDDEVSSVVVALDPTYAALCATREFGANVLVTHHPLFLDPPTRFVSFGCGDDVAGSRVHAALSWGISCLNYHTPLDASVEAAVLPTLMGLEFSGELLQPLGDAPHLGYGQVCEPAGGGLTVGELAARCKAVFERPARVWGDPDAPIARAATATGAAGNVVDAALGAGVECLVCGEVKYHQALDASERGLAIIELGHDVSELPLTLPLARAVAQAGVSTERIHVYNQGMNWYSA
ncbi:Nif3-like dinuclear metal center hexameric protein [Eggerthellaceae bacterium zg-1084]|uniref:GTP cyclohydrolase 1 type 2 homolog n=1 Tax=Berryella wangjianweii TaxID=2734634 RepID=A0A6M8J464_9ACTN|nr:Nif3-like dinuclear metal center hexameric protein [Berryella wangjianweii]NPD31235.1 Nif3-like dinuclear metal center hexameric protein [Berryella wangjianweii]QKF06786.1 Nif3-like dinuclear metal center hexameric protein [Berryella wangjianweii]